MKKLIKKIMPKFFLTGYHWFLAKLGAVLYNHPSRHLVVIGVTGTKGKSTVVNLIAGILEEAGYKVGLSSTIKFKIGEREWINDTKQTMPGRFKLQKMLAQMVRAGCRYAVVETSSEGIAQCRHAGVVYDVAVFTNLSPEHVESHGSYENYAQAKLKLFRCLNNSERKIINNKEIKKVTVANLDDPAAERFLRYTADEKWGYGTIPNTQFSISNARIVLGQYIVARPDGVEFTVNNEKIDLCLLGKFNVSNALAALAVGFSQGLGLQVMKRALEKVSCLPGRLEEIANNRGFRIFIDYAHEPASLEAVYRTIRDFNPKKIISVLGSQGGGRDKAKRPILGKLAAQYTDYVIVTNEDPYDEDPQDIVNEVARGAEQVARSSVEKILDRREAIKRALGLAQAGDVVIITGKGSETVMAVAGDKKVPWDDRRVVRELL